MNYVAEDLDLEGDESEAEAVQEPSRSVGESHQVEGGQIDLNIFLRVHSRRRILPKEHKYLPSIHEDDQTEEEIYRQDYPTSPEVNRAQFHLPPPISLRHKGIECPVEAETSGVKDRVHEEVAHAEAGQDLLLLTSGHVQQVHYFLHGVQHDEND